MTAPRMHPRIAELVAVLDAERRDLLAAVERVPAEHRERRPAEGAWSVAEVLEHLWRVEKGVARLYEVKVAEARANGLGPETETSTVLRSLDERRVHERVVKMEAPERVRPRDALTAAQALEHLLDSRTALRAALLGADGLALGQIRYPHAALGELDLYQWALFVAQHEARHRKQIEEIAASLR